MVKKKEIKPKEVKERPKYAEPTIPLDAPVPNKLTIIHMILTNSIDLTHSEIEQIYEYCGKKLRTYHEEHLR